MIDTQAIKERTDLVQLAGQYTQLRKIATTNGGEYEGPCPRCGGHDRFHVQAAGLFMCRQCHDTWGDAIEFIRWLDGRSFLEAAMTLDNGELDYSRPAAAPAIKPAEPENDRDKWIAACQNLMAESYETLLSDQGTRAREYLKSRGITEDSIHRWQLGFIPVSRKENPETWGLMDRTDPVFIPHSIVIPCWDEAGLHYVKFRKPEPDNNGRKYSQIPGGHGWPFGINTITEKEPYEAFLFESEFDAMLARETGFAGVGYLALPGGQMLPAASVPWMRSIHNLIVATDNDDEGERTRTMYEGVPGVHLAERFTMEKGDLTKYYQAGGDVLEWLFRQVQNALGANE